MGRKPKNREDNRVDGIYSEYTKARKVLELYKMIRNGEAQNKAQLSQIFGVDESTIKNYIGDLRDVWGADISYKGRRYVLESEGILGMLKTTYPITHYDATILLTTLVQASPFMETKIEIIKKALMDLLPKEEVHKFEAIFKVVRDNSKDSSSVEEVIRKIVDSIIHNQKIKVTYENTKKERKTYRYIPYTIAYDQGKYYLIAKRDDKGYMNHLRLDQIKLIENIDERFIPVEDFQITNYLKKTWYMYTGSETKVKVKFHRDCKKVVVERNMCKGKILEECDEHFIYEFTCNGTDGIKLWIMGFMDKAEVLEPIGLRKNIKESIQKMQELYT